MIMSMKDYFKYKTAGIIGMWFALSILGFNANNETKGFIAFLGIIGTFLIAIFGSGLRN